MYTDPGGATDATLPLDTWPSVVEANPILKQMRPDIEALLVNRVGSTREHFIALMDECFKLVRLIRMY